MLGRGLRLCCPPRVIDSNSIPPHSATVDRPGDRPDAKLCPPRCDRTGPPYTSFGPAVRKVNALVAAAMPSLERGFPGRVDGIVEVPSWRCQSLRAQPLGTHGLGPEPLHALGSGTSTAQSPAAAVYAAFSERSACANVAQFILRLPKQVGYVDCGAPFVNHLHGNANSDMGAAAPSENKHAAPVLLSACLAALGWFGTPMGQDRPAGGPATASGARGRAGRLH